MTELKHKTCKQCGQIKVETEFRPYYNNPKTVRTGRYRICLSCESINTRYKYLNTKLKKTTIKDHETEELNKINQLFDLLRERGLQPPAKAPEHRPIVQAVNELIQIHSAAVEAAVQVGSTAATPDELTEWLSRDLSAYNPDELEGIMNELESKYRPQVGVDPNTFKPIFDNTHQDILLKIEDRFEDYSDNYVWE